MAWVESLQAVNYPYVTFKGSCSTAAKVAFLQPHKPQEKSLHLNDFKEIFFPSHSPPPKKLFLLLSRDKEPPKEAIEAYGQCWIKVWLFLLLLSTRLTGKGKDDLESRPIPKTAIHTDLLGVWHKSSYFVIEYFFLSNLGIRFEISKWSLILEASIFFA